ncbi:hypothetical protein [Mucilaginibacter panaciglaebae]|uniref:Lipoprotein n=1 Tax=Mucilaginibacter panaciglaebae TaxID=502331 RepID=A0ABP7WCN9_9SPHI
MKKVLAFVSCILVLFASCKKDKQQAPTYYITADVDGVPVSFTTNNLAKLSKATLIQSNKLYLYGAAGLDENSDVISINITEPQALTQGSTYTATIDDTHYVGITYVTGPFSPTRPNQYTSYFDDGGMGITITSLTDKGIEGTFRGTLANINNGTEKKLTNGKFKLIFNY